jgi:conserved hypothetical protein
MEELLSPVAAGNVRHCHLPQEKEKPMGSVESTVRAYFEALNRSDVEGVVSAFADDGTFMADEMEAAIGEDQIRRTFQGAFQARSFQRELHVDEVREGEDMASARTHTTGTITMLADNNVVSVVSRELFVLRKSAEGWRITDYMFNRPANPGS